MVGRMTDRTVGPMTGRVVVVTGAGGGIGSGAARELARQGATVVAVDNGAGVQGEPLREPTAQATVDQIVAEGGTARASTVSVTDRAELAQLFAEVRADLGSLDAVLNTAGFLHYAKLPLTDLGSWQRVVGVHLEGWLNVLSAALPIMSAAGYGRLVGVTSGVGLGRTSVDGPEYGSAKRSVASLTWQLAPLLPSGVTVNALSPIAATRMVTSALVAAGASPKGLDLSAMPQPESMASTAAYLCSEQVGWCSGRVVFCAGTELSLVGPPRLLEVVRTERVTDFAQALGTVVPEVLVPAEAAQRTTGGSNPRFGPILREVSA
jgi:NAD(P)-dependent dehydrogenase (short-subunit alcohol dehydrogenase family)